MQIAIWRILILRQKLKRRYTHSLCTHNSGMQAHTKKASLELPANVRIAMETEYTRLSFNIHLLNAVFISLWTRFVHVTVQSHNQSTVPCKIKLHITDHKLTTSSGQACSIPQTSKTQSHIFSSRAIFNNPINIKHMNIKAHCVVYLQKPSSMIFLQIQIVTSWLSEDWFTLYFPFIIHCFHFSRSCQYTLHHLTKPFSNQPAPNSVWPIEPKPWIPVQLIKPVQLTKLFINHKTLH